MDWELKTIALSIFSMFVRKEEPPIVKNFPNLKFFTSSF